MAEELWVVCDACEGAGIIAHDCGEDSCCCLDDDDEECYECDGDGGYWEKLAKVSTEAVEDAIREMGRK